MIGFHDTERRAFDVGVVNVDDGTEGYVIQSNSSVRHALPPSGALGPFTLGAHTLIALHEVVLPAGGWHVRLLNTGDEQVDLGVSVHAPDSMVQSKSDATAASWLSGAGADEEFDFLATDPGAYVFPVWRVSAADLGIVGQYQVEITPIPLDVRSDKTPVATRLSGITPNPFNLSSILSFELAEVASVSLEVYDLKGARVRTLVDGRRSAGRHEVVWNGEGDRGRPLPAGVYFVRLKAGTRELGAKMVKIR